LSFVGSIGQNADRLLFGTVGAPWLVQLATTGDTCSLDADVQQRLRQGSGAESVRSRLDISANLANSSAPTDRPESVSVSLVGVDLSAESSLAANFGLPSKRLSADSIVLADKVARQLGVTEGQSIELVVGTRQLSYQIDKIVSPVTPDFLLDSWVIVD